MQQMIYVRSLAVTAYTHYFYFSSLADFCITPPPAQTPPPTAVAPQDTDDFTLTFYDVEPDFESHSDVSEGHEGRRDDVVSQFIDSIPDDILAGVENADEGDGEDGGNWDVENAGSIVGDQTTTDISALGGRLTILEGMVRSTTQHDAQVLTSAAVNTELLREQNKVLEKVSTAVGVLTDKVVEAEKERRKDARRQRVVKKEQCKQLNMIRETLLALTSQIEVTGEKIANATAQHTTAMRLLHAAPRLDTILESTSDTPSSSRHTSPPTLPPPVVPLRRGLRLQRGGKMCSDK